MSSELKRSKCLEQIYHLSYKGEPNLVHSGRYIKSLRHVQTLTTDENEKLKYEYKINRCLHKHIIFLQESIINSYGKTSNYKIDSNTVNTIKNLANSDYSIRENNMSIIDIDGLKKLKAIKKSVLLKEDLLIPCKVLSTDKKYKFNTQIIVTKNNVLTYAINDLEFEQTNNLNHNVLLTKVGKGIQNLTNKENQNIR